MNLPGRIISELILLSPTVVTSSAYFFKYAMIAFTIVYAIMQLLYILFSRSLPEFYKPYNKLYYFLFAFSGLCFWVLGYRKISIQQKQLLWVQNVFLLLMCILTAMELSTINIVNAFGTNDEKFLFLYQNLSYILLWLFIPLYMPWLLFLHLLNQVLPWALPDSFS